jgi:chromosome partitioning protein
LVEGIKTRQQYVDDLKAFFVINRTIKHTKLSIDVDDALKEYEIPLFKSRTTQRIVYASSANQGQTVYESKDKRAIQEIDDICDELNKEIH